MKNDEDIIRGNGLLLHWRVHVPTARSWWLWVSKSDSATTKINIFTGASSKETLSLRSSPKELEAERLTDPYVAQDDGPTHANNDISMLATPLS